MTKTTSPRVIKGGTAKRKLDGLFDAMYLLLTTDGGITFDDLSKELKVQRSTGYRYVKTLKAKHVKGKRGFYTLTPSPEHVKLAQAILSAAEQK